MNAVKTLMLAGLAALSVSVGAVIAQDGISQALTNQAPQILQSADMVDRQTPYPGVRTDVFRFGP